MVPSPWSIPQSSRWARASSFSAALVDDDDLVLVLDQGSGDGLAEAGRAEDDDAHGFLPP